MIAVSSSTNEIIIAGITATSVVLVAGFGALGKILSSIRRDHDHIKFRLAHQDDVLAHSDSVITERTAQIANIEHHVDCIEKDVKAVAVSVAEVKGALTIITAQTRKD